MTASKAIAAGDSLLTINGGSSSIRFALYEASAPLKKRIAGKIERIGLADPQFTVTHTEAATAPPRQGILARDHREACEFLINWLAARPAFAGVAAIGHRVVHGMNHAQPELITAELIGELRRVIPYDPEHLPSEIQLIEALQSRLPLVPQVACFDTAFHRNMPRVAKLLPIPRRYAQRGLQRYGFHGLSYQYLVDELARRVGVSGARGRLILAHLGNGASIAAVRDGQSIDTSMGFTPAGGLVMSTRSGDLDPGVSLFLANADHMQPAQLQQLFNHESGLLGVSETSSDVRDLLSKEREDERAAEALSLFCYQVKKWIGAFAAALGGLDTLVFSGGIGENAAPLRARICEGLSFAGVVLDPERNRLNAPLISSGTAPVGVHVISTDEEIVIAQSTLQILNQERTSTRQPNP